MEKTITIDVVTRKMNTGGPLARAVADEIKSRQAVRGWSNREFATMIGVTHPYVGERYKYRADFTLDDVANAANVFGISPEDLLQAAMRRM